MTISDTYIAGEKWESTFTLINVDGDVVNGSDVTIKLRRQNDGSEFRYVVGSDPEATQSGSGTYVFDGTDIRSGFYDVEWSAEGINAERVRSTIRVKAEL